MDLATLFIVVAIIYGVLFFFDSFFKVRISDMDDCNLAIAESMLLNVSCFRAVCITLTSLCWKELD